MSFSAEDASYLSNITYATMEFSIFSSSWSMLNDRAIFQLQALEQPLGFLWCSTFRISGQFCWLSRCRSIINWILSKHWWSTLSSRYWQSYTLLYISAIPNHQWQIYLGAPLGHIRQRRYVHPTWHPLPTVDQPATLTFLHLLGSCCHFKLYFHSNPLIWQYLRALS